jgi:hypothetical protein
VRTLAGGVRQGSVNGIGTEALFNSPQGIWGSNGYLYIADGLNRVYRQLDLATLEVTTLAGAFGVSGSNDGTFETARFQLPGAVWGSGAVLYVADLSAIRTISLEARTVRTLAILPTNAGIRALWGRGNVLYAYGYTRSGSVLTGSLYRIATDTGEVSDVLRGIKDSNPGLPISFADARGISGSSTDLFIATGTDNEVRRLIPDALPALAKLEIPNPGYSSRTTAGASATISVGQARIGTTSGNVTPTGFAIFALRQNGVLIS